MDFLPAHYTYLIINVLIIAYPLAQSYEHRLRFLGQWKAIFTSMAIVGAIYLAWDELFTRLEVWGFNERYLIGIYFGHLPLEEVLFFVTAPFSCLFIYEVLNYFVPRDILGPYRLAFTWFFLLVALFLGIYFYPRLYTSAACFMAAILLGYQLVVRRSSWLGRFFLAYLVTLIPFITMNGWLTGSFTEEPIVWYSQLEIIGMRIGTVPIEDSIYLLGYFLLLTSLYEQSKAGRKTHRRVVP